MFKDFIEYNFSGEVNDYLTSYDSSKLNMGHLMYRLTDETGQTYVTPTETKFLRGFEIGGVSGGNNFRINNLGFIKYTDNISWVFYTNYDTLGTVVKRIFLATYDKSLNELKEIGSINVNYNPNATHFCNSLIPSLENHTGGTVTVVGNTVSGSGTTWSTDGVCSGNRIGFGSTNPEDITTWYTISSVVDNTNLIISREYPTDGIIENLNISGGTPYVIEDLRLIYVNRAGSAVATTRGIALVKGLRIENFTPLPLTIPAATTIDNLRACYRLLDSATTSATFIPTGIILEDKVSLTEQYLFVQSNPATTSINIQRFNVRAALTLTAGRSDSAFNFTTGTVNHNGTNNSIINPFIKGSNGDYYVNLFTRVSRIIPANITNGSTTFIGDTMIENPPGTSTTFPLSSQLLGFSYLPNADRFYISHNQGTTKNYVTPYSTSGEFERVVNLNDVIESNTYVVSELDTLTSNFISLPLRTFYHDGLSYVARDVANNRNVLYTLPIEADKEYHTTTKACIITPEFTTPDVVNYDKVYLRTKSTYNKGRFISPSENVDIYFRTSGITDDSGSWTLVDKTGDISYTSGSTIQFKIAFSTIGLTCIPDKVYGITMSYFSNGIPLSTPFYEPSLKQSNISSQIFSWRQIYEFVGDIPKLNVDIYNVNGNILLLTDDTDNSLNGVWEYSSDDGVSWNGFTSSANTVGNYIRYIPNSSLGSGITVKPIIYKFTFGGSFSSFVGLLDLYPNAAAAWSLRKLRSDYTGACIRVRRSSDNAEQDIGFMNNVLDTATLLAFVGGGNGFVTTLYGTNYNQFSNTLTTQPQIVTNGVLNVNMLKPTLQWALSRGLGNDNNLTITPTSELWLFIVANVTQNNVGTQILFEQTTNFNDNQGSLVVYIRDGQLLVSQRNAFYTTRQTSIPLGRSLISLRIRSGVTVTNFIEIYINGISVTTTTFSNHNQNSIGFINAPVFTGARNLSTSSFVGDLQELIIYNSNQSSNRVGIETNINNYYAIY
jgi:hypothetical protein